MFFKKKKTREEIIQENEERHQRYGIDFAPDVPDDDPLKWIDEAEMADEIFGDW